MVIATFGPSTGWAGKTIIFENKRFILEGHGPISAQDVMQYDRQGHLVWADSGTRAWVGGLATSPPPAGPRAVAAKPARTSPSAKSSKPTSGAQRAAPPASTRKPKARAKYGPELTAGGRLRTKRVQKYPDTDPASQRKLRHKYSLQQAKTPTVHGTTKAAASGFFPGTPGDARTEGQKVAAIIGLILLIIGLASTFYYLAIFEVSVPVDYPSGVDSLGILFPDRVNNIGLMADRNNGITFGLVLAVGGGILMYIGRPRKRSAATVVGETRSESVAPALKACLSCGGMMDGHAAYCPHCGKKRMKKARGKCNICDGVMDVGVAYCPHCGKKLSWPGAASQEG